MAGEFYHSPAVAHSVPEAYFEKTFEELMHSDVYADCFVAEESGILQGYALIAKTFSQEAGGLCVWIEEMYVFPDARGKGIGTLLFDRIHQEYPRAARFRLEVEEDNVSAIRLYQRLGYEFLEYRQMVRDR